MATPADEALYEKTKNEVDKIYDKPSAYRSMAYTRFYLKAYREKYGSDKNAYKGKRPGDLQKWRNEKWIDIRSFVDTPEDPKPCGAIEYKRNEYPLCMPERKAKTYTQSELIALLNRKAELGKTRLVKEPYLRDIGISDKEPELKLKGEKKKEQDLKVPKEAEEVKPKVRKPRALKVKEVDIKDIKEEKITESQKPTVEQGWYKRRLERLREATALRNRDRPPRPEKVSQPRERAKKVQPMMVTREFVPEFTLDFS